MHKAMMQKATDAKFTPNTSSAQLSTITMNRPAPDAHSQMSDIAPANLSQLIDYSSIRSIPEIWDLVKQRFPQTVALDDPDSQPEIKLTYTDLYQQIQ